MQIPHDTAKYHGELFFHLWSFLYKLIAVIRKIPLIRELILYESHYPLNYG